MPSYYQLSLVLHQLNNSVIEQRKTDGYINATSLCRAAKKKWHNYYRLEQTGHFLRALSSKTTIEISELVENVVENGEPSVWVHPKVALNLAQWLSAEFAVQVTEWVTDFMAGKTHLPIELPSHINRYILNDPKIPVGYFSILQETTLGLIAPLHNLGFIIPNGWVPDISVGKSFCKWLREIKEVDTDCLNEYEHMYTDGRVVNAKLYPDELLADCRSWFKSVWLPTNGARYFRKKDPECMQYFDQIPAITNLKKDGNRNTLDKK